MQTRQLWGERERGMVIDRKRGVEILRVREMLRITHREVRGEKLRQRRWEGEEVGSSEQRGSHAPLLSLRVSLRAGADFSSP